MQTDKPNIDVLEKAINRLQEGMARYQADVTDTQIRDGLIQRFASTYELSHRTLKRYLKQESAMPEKYDSMPFQELIRSGNQQGILLGEWSDWEKYREMRSKTSHSYDDRIGLEVVAGLQNFLREVLYLKDQLKQSDCDGDFSVSAEDRAWLDDKPTGNELL